MINKQKLVDTFFDFSLDNEEKKEKKNEYLKIPLSSKIESVSNTANHGNATGINKSSTDTK